MTAVIPAGFKPTPLPKPRALVQIVDPQTGSLTSDGVQFFSRIRDYVNAGNRIIPCSASGKNLITLTPNDATPFLEGYLDYEVFAFTAAQTSDGAVTATVVPLKGTLATIKVFKTNGSAQAGAGDVVAGSLYLAIYSDGLDTGAGGFVIK